MVLAMAHGAAALPNVAEVLAPVLARVPRERQPLPTSPSRRFKRGLEQRTLFGRRKQAGGGEHHDPDSNTAFETVLEQLACRRREVLLPVASRFEPFLPHDVGVIAIP